MFQPSLVLQHCLPALPALSASSLPKFQHCQPALCQSSSIVSQLSAKLPALSASSLPKFQHCLPALCQTSSIVCLCISLCSTRPCQLFCHFCQPCSSLLCQPARVTSGSAVSVRILATFIVAPTMVLFLHCGRGYISSTLRSQCRRFFTSRHSSGPPLQTFLGFAQFKIFCLLFGGVAVHTLANVDAQSCGWGKTICRESNFGV